MELKIEIKSELSTVSTDELIEARNKLNDLTTKAIAEMDAEIDNRNQQGQEASILNAEYLDQFRIKVGPDLKPMAYEPISMDIVQRKSSDMIKFASSQLHDVAFDPTLKGVTMRLFIPDHQGNGYWTVKPTWIDLEPSQARILAEKLTETARMIEDFDRGVEEYFEQEKSEMPIQEAWSDLFDKGDLLKQGLIDMVSKLGTPYQQEAEESFYRTLNEFKKAYRVYKTRQGY